MRFQQTTYPTATDIISRDQAKEHLRVEHTADDALIDTLIAVAHDLVEAYTGRFLQTTSGVFYFDTFKEYMNLHGGPNMTIVATSVSGTEHGVTYIDSNGQHAVVEAKDYEFDSKSYPARLRMLDIPTDVKETLNSVKVFVTSGYINSDDRPDALIAAMLLIIGHLYENRQDVGQHKTYETPLASRYLMEPNRLKSFA